jgi:hypothetical protein
VFVAAGISEQILSIRSANELLRFTMFRECNLFLWVYGFFSFAAFGAMYYIVPRLLDFGWRSALLIKAHYYASLYGILLVIAMLGFGGVMQGLTLENPDPQVTIATAIHHGDDLLPHRGHHVHQPDLHRQRHLCPASRLDAPRLAPPPRSGQPPAAEILLEPYEGRLPPNRPRRSPHDRAPLPHLLLPRPLVAFLFTWLAWSFFRGELGHLPPIQDEASTDITPWDLRRGPRRASGSTPPTAAPTATPSRSAPPVPAPTSSAAGARPRMRGRQEQVTRRTYPRDYIWQHQVFLGNSREGADLSNVAQRFPDAAELYRYLYDPYVLNPTAACPPTVPFRHAKDQRAALG